MTTVQATQVGGGSMTSTGPTATEQDELADFPQAARLVALAQRRIKAKTPQPR